MLETPSDNCPGYPPLFLKEEKPNEKINFYIPIEGDKEVLACSWISAPTETIVTKRIEKNDLATKESVPSLDDIYPLSLNKIDRSKFVIIICHGLASWRNQKLLAHLASELTNELSCHTLRFDFRGNGHSSGDWEFDGYEREFMDLCIACNFVKETLKCKVKCIIGHSQGSAAVLKYAAMLDDQSFFNLSREGRVGEECEKIDIERIYYVNLAGRCMKKPIVELKAKFSHRQQEELNLTGRMHLMTKGDRDMIITMQSLMNRSSHDMSEVAARIKVSKVLTIHGSKDEIVPVTDAEKIHQIIPNHSLKIIEDANHDFKGLTYIEDIVSAISSFLSNEVIL